MAAVPAMPTGPQIQSQLGPLQFGRFSTKLAAPRLRANLVEREQLLRRISDAESPVTVICAPAGYGKSTLVTQWLTSAQVPNAWVSLDTYDNDPVDFFSLVIGSIQSIDRDVGAITTQLLNENKAPTSSAIARALLDDVYSTTRPFALIFDDYHSIENIEIHSAMSTILQNLPPSLRVFIISRNEPPLHLARQRGRQELFELGHEDLRFTDGEALALLHRTNGLELTPSDVTSINDRTEGWAAGCSSYVKSCAVNPRLACANLPRSSRAACGQSRVIFGKK